MLFTNKEKKVILDWFEYVSEDSKHYGDGLVIFPDEARLIKKLKKQEEETDFNEFDIRMIVDWMNTNIKRRYGDAKFLIGEECSLFTKLAKINL